MNVAARVCRSPDSWAWTDQSQISLPHLPTPPKCSTRAHLALINNLGIVYHQYCSSSTTTTTMATSAVMMDPWAISSTGKACTPAARKMAKQRRVNRLSTIFLILEALKRRQLFFVLLLIIQRWPLQLRWQVSQRLGQWLWQNLCEINWHG
jgi:hypothetical protein